MKWQPGRQNSGYTKLPLAIGKSFDVHLLRFPKGSEVDVHTDALPDGRHYRLNILLKAPKRGGRVYVKGKPILSLLRGRLCLFRPDIQDHYMTEVKEGRAYYLTIGWLRKDPWVVYYL